MLFNQVLVLIGYSLVGFGELWVYTMVFSADFRTIESGRLVIDGGAMEGASFNQDVNDLSSMNYVFKTYGTPYTLHGANSCPSNEAKFVDHVYEEFPCREASGCSATLNFPSVDHAYLTFEQLPASSRKHDDETPMPAAKALVRPTWNEVARTYTGEADWNWPKTVFSSAYKWKFSVQFSEDYASIIGGSVELKNLDGSTFTVPFRPGDVTHVNSVEAVHYRRRGGDSSSGGGTSGGGGDSGGDTTLIFAVVVLGLCVCVGVVGGVVALVVGRETKTANKEAARVSNRLDQLQMQEQGMQMQGNMGVASYPAAGVAGPGAFAAGGQYHANAPGMPGTYVEGSPAQQNVYGPRSPRSPLSNQTGEFAMQKPPQAQVSQCAQPGRASANSKPSTPFRKPSNPPARQPTN